jgi:hypothetical protein
VCDGRPRRGVVELPAYFEALNRDFRYQLTVIGEFAQAIVGSEIGNRFVIRTDKPASGLLAGDRHPQDPWAETNRIVVEQDKPEAERGVSPHPAAYGQPPEATSKWCATLRGTPSAVRHGPRPRCSGDAAGSTTGAEETSMPTTRTVAFVITLLLASIAAPARAAFSGTDVFLPSVGQTAGISNWYTTVWVHNPHTVQATAQFTFLVRDQVNTSATAITKTIAAGIRSGTPTS